MENQLENMNHRIEVIEDSLQSIIKTLSNDYMQLHNHLADYKEQKAIEQEANEKFLEFLEQNNKEMAIAQRINQSHFEAQHYIKDQTEVLKGVFHKTYAAFVDNLNVFGVHIKQLNSRIDAIPVSYSIKNHHHIEPKSKGMFVLIGSLLFLSVAGLAWGFVNHSLSKDLQADHIKYRMFRQQLPGLNQRIDSIFYENPERAAAVVSKLEAETELRKAAEIKRKEAEEMAKEAAMMQEKERKTY